MKKKDNSNQLSMELDKMWQHQAKDVSSKQRYWWCILYPESAIDNWDKEIFSLVQLPFCYCVHDKDIDSKGDKRKEHVHIIICFPSPTTYKHALTVFSQLGEVNICKPIINIRWAYDYLIHDTEDSKKKKKYLYDREERVVGNNFDIGFFEQDSLYDKKRIRSELSRVVINEFFTNYTDFYSYVVSNYEPTYEDVLCSYSGHFERLTKGNYNKKVCKLNEDFNKQQEILSELLAKK